jgi:phosphate starvation-inducible protein PhoH
VPLTDNQKVTFDAYADGMDLMLHGFAGTGKSFISCYLAAEELDSTDQYENITLIRSVVSTRDMGFLPGTINDKSGVYAMPYHKIFADLYGRGDAYSLLESKGRLKFETTSFLRGHTLDNTIIIVDEMQNMTFQELDTVMTRGGENSKIIFCGDFRQTDLDQRDRQGLTRFINITKRMNRFEYIEFDKEDIVRGGRVKDYIIARTEMEDE